MGDLGLGRRAQPSQVTGTDRRLPSARRGRSGLLPSSHRASNGSVTHTNELHEIRGDSDCTLDTVWTEQFITEATNAGTA